MSSRELREIKYPNTTFKQQYMIDTEGNVYSPWRGLHKMSIRTNPQGYKDLYLYTNEYGRKCYKVHRLVMETFKPQERSTELQVNHIDGNKSNNSLDNLEWCTRSENLKHAFKIGLEENPKGEKNPAHKLIELEVIEICKKLENKETLQTIANEYDVSKSCIAAIKQRRTWQEISKNYNF